MAWYIPVYRVEWADISVLLGGQDWSTTTIRRDLTLEESLRARAQQFMDDYVLTGEPPPVDGSQGWKDYLSKQFPKEEEGLLPADLNAETLVLHLKSVRERLKTLEEDEGKLINQLKVIIGDNLGLQGPNWKVTWKCNKDGLDQDWAKISRELFDLLVANDRPKLALEDKAQVIMQAHSKLVKGARVFRPSFPKEEK